MLEVNKRKERRESRIQVERVKLNRGDGVKIDLPLY